MAINLEYDLVLIEEKKEEYIQSNYHEGLYNFNCEQGFYYQSYEQGFYHQGY